MVELSVLLAEAGGRPEVLHDCSAVHAGLVASVVLVLDDSLDTQQDDGAKSSKRGSVPQLVHFESYRAATKNTLFSHPTHFERQSV